MADRLILRLMEFKFFTSMEQPSHCPRCCSHLNESATFSSPSKNAWRTSSHSEQGPAVLILHSGLSGWNIAMRTRSLRDGQLAPGLTMTLPFMFGWIEHK
jgi:hypothetical protein